MTSNKLPPGFLAAGRNVGIKNSRRDFGVIVSELPATFASVVTTNKSRAPSTVRTARIRDAGHPVRAIVAVSGNANCLTGEGGVRDDAALAASVAYELGVQADEVLTAATGLTCARLPMSRVLEGVEPALREVSDDPTVFAESILTTDRRTKILSRELFIEGVRIKLHAVTKGGGMIRPGLATTLCFVTTDACIDRLALQRALRDAVDASFNQLTIDNDMSTNDSIMVLANGWAENAKITEESEDYETFAIELRELLTASARLVAADGEGASRLIDVEVSGAERPSDARAIARAIAGSMLVKSAVFGADPNVAGRILGAAGAAAATANAAFDPATLRLFVQDQCIFEAGEKLPIETASFRYRLMEPEVRIVLDLAQGEAMATSFGCDLSYDYVKINADYAAITSASAEGTVSINERLSEMGPSIKKRVLIEALSYIDKFNGMRAVIKIGDTAMVDPALEEQFAEDVLLLDSVGLRPIVVHGSGQEISKTLQSMGRPPVSMDGLSPAAPEAMAVIEMVLTGNVNQRLVAALNRIDSRAVGLSGKDGGLIRARKVRGDRDLGRVGEIESIDTALVERLEKDGYVPVISPIGLGEGGLTYGLDADVAAAELARALKAEKLIFLGDVPGLLEGDKVVSELNGDQLKARLDRGEFSGNMRTKLEAVLAALRGGVRSVHLVDGRVAHNLIAELFTDRGVGTLIRAS